MNRHVPKAVPLLIVLWLLVFAPSFAVYSSIQPLGDGFTRGLNRALPFILMQLIALVLAVASLLVGIRKTQRMKPLIWLLAALPLLFMLSALALRVWLLFG